MPSTAARLSSIARRMASPDSGTRPICQAAPKIIMLEKIESPSSALASACASKNATRSFSRASSDSRRRSVGNRNSVFRVKSPVMISCAFTTAPV